MSQDLCPPSGPCPAGCSVPLLPLRTVVQCLKTYFVCFVRALRVGMVSVDSVSPSLAVVWTRSTRNTQWGEPAVLRRQCRCDCWSALCGLGPFLADLTVCLCEASSSRLSAVLNKAVRGALAVGLEMSWLRAGAARLLRQSRIFVTAWGP